MPEQEEIRTIAYLCPDCRQTVIARRSLFAMAAAPVKLPCPCGKSTLTIELTPSQARLSVPCPFCGRAHEVRCGAAALAGEETVAFSCAASGLTCCCVGQERAVYAAARRMEEAADKLEREQERAPEEKQAFLDEVIMHEVLSELKEIARRGGISCTCGSKAWGLRVNYSSVDLTCRACGGCLRLPAASADDLDDLCCHRTLTIRGKENGHGTDL